jgi:hypothetical protein
VAFQLPQYHDSSHRALVATFFRGGRAMSQVILMQVPALPPHACPGLRKLILQQCSVVLWQSTSDPSCASGMRMTGSPTKHGPWLDSGQPCSRLESCCVERGGRYKDSSGLLFTTIGRLSLWVSANQLRQSWQKGTCRRPSAS